tara:strand:+ start:1757 stop:2197 length:441 start_codon:yes stop_codon:yes gene_type:complete
VADLSEVWKEVRDILVGDATLTAMLASASSVYERDPPLQTGFPMLTLWQVADGPANAVSSYGEFHADVQIDVWSTSPRTNEQIKSRLDELLEIPRVVTTQISSTNYNVTNCTRTNSRFVGTVEIEDDGKHIRHLATEWRVTIRKTT